MFLKKCMAKKLALKLPNVSENVIYTHEGDTQSAGNIFLKKYENLFNNWFIQ